MKPWVVIPAFNESKHILSVLKRLGDYNVVVVDDGSDDRTADAAEQAGVVVLKHIINLGKGAALKTGCDYAVKKGAKKIIAVDADGQHDPAEIPKLASSLDTYDVALGFRTLTKMPMVFKLGNSFINIMTRILYGIQVRDSQCGFRAFTKDAYLKMRWQAQDYSMESEMIANIGKKGLSYTEVPIRTIYRDKYKGTTVLDGMRIVFDMIVWRLKG